ncbi:thioredoxin-disulfide reductase [Thermodesulfobacterium sp. TA1]|uniref:thioredoxin-disulfide reductase n=1 Tax=Thermodesulfobacterium sp. TA1 TaxID=2234087 RepID=UPI001231CA16|nr:thioredoxin-disulfide reductase [Thermodesulfobacterium sp. TA1]QER42636.1 thioredoxin-disulfide reductase [Thermodesulfobacterium sp. TA1]
MNETKVYDLIIVGGGPAGLTSYLYAQRGLLNTLLVEKNFLGGQVVLTDQIENYPGFPEGISGFELIEKMVKQVEKLGLNLVQKEVVKIEKIENQNLIFKIWFSDGTYTLSYAVILALGASPKRLGIPGEKEFIGKGVSFCATCDGPFFKDEVIAVVGGGDSALKEALTLTKFVKKVFLIHRRDKFRAEPYLQKLVLQNPKIEILWNSTVEAIEGNQKVEKIKVLNKLTGEKIFLEVAGIFIFIGYEPNTFWLKGLVEVDPEGFILTDKAMQTSQQGVFACGDCVSKPFRQIIIACGEGALAALSAKEYIAHVKTS